LRHKKINTNQVTLNRTHQQKNGKPNKTNAKCLISNKLFCHSTRFLFLTKRKHLKKFSLKTLQTYVSCFIRSLAPEFIYFHKKNVQFRSNRSQIDLSSQTYLYMRLDCMICFAHALQTQLFIKAKKYT
jgi:hypothetical protein